MEHRCSARFASHLDVVVRRSDGLLEFGKIMNSSKLGFFIVMDASRVNLFQMMDVEILYGQEDYSPYRHICSVCVIRKTDAGIGVEIESSRLEPSNVIPLKQPVLPGYARQLSGAAPVPASNN